MHLQFCGIGIESTNSLLTCLASQCASCNKAVTAIFLFQRKYPPAGSECLWWILHDLIHFPEVVHYDIVYFCNTPEKFFQVLVIRIMVAREITFLFS